MLSDLLKFCHAKIQCIFRWKNHWMANERRSQLRHVLLATSLWGNRKKETEAKEAILVCTASDWRDKIVCRILLFLLSCCVVNVCLLCSWLLIAASWAFEIVQGCLLECQFCKPKRVDCSIPTATKLFPLPVGKGKGDAGRRWACKKTFTNWFENALPWQVWYDCVSLVFDPCSSILVQIASLPTWTPPKYHP